MEVEVDVSMLPPEYREALQRPVIVKHSNKGCLVFLTILLFLALAGCGALYYFYYNTNSDKTALQTELSKVEKIIGEVVCQSTTREKIGISPVTHVQKTSDGGFYILSHSAIGKTTSLGVLDWKYSVGKNEVASPLILESGDNTYAVLDVEIGERVVLLDKQGKELSKVELGEQFSWNTQILQTENGIMLMGVSSVSNTTSLLFLSHILEVQSQYVFESLTIINRAHYDLNSGSLYLSGQTYRSNLYYFCLLQLANDFTEQMKVETQSYDRSQGLLFNNTHILSAHSNYDPASLILTSVNKKDIEKTLSLTGYDFVFGCVINSGYGFVCAVSGEESGAVLGINHNLEISWSIELKTMRPVQLESLNSKRFFALFDSKTNSQQAYVEVDPVGRVLAQDSFTSSEYTLYNAQPVSTKELYMIIGDKAKGDFPTLSLIFSSKLGLANMEKYCNLIPE